MQHTEIGVRRPDIGCPPRTLVVGVAYTGWRVNVATGCQGARGALSSAPVHQGEQDIRHPDEVVVQDGLVDPSIPVMRRR
jgi:hypothetical protein